MEGAIKWLRQIVYGNPLFILGGLGMALRGSHALSFWGTRRDSVRSSTQLKSLTKRRLGTNYLCDTEGAPSQLLEAEGCIDSRFRIQTRRGPLKTQRQHKTNHSIDPHFRIQNLRSPLKETTKTEQGETLHRSVLRIHNVRDRSFVSEHST